MRSTLRSILAAAALLTGLAAATIAVPAAPASAAACGDANGVTVVVDPQQLGGGVQEVCDGGGAGKTAAAIFEESGFHQSYAVNGGMVCQVNGAPAGDVCRNDPPATAYWSLWWSDGSTGWTYSSLGVGSLRIPAGGSVAWAWQGQSTKNLPSVAPAKTVAAPAPATQTKAPQSVKPVKSPAKPVTTRSAKAISKPATQHSGTPTPSASLSASASVSPSAAASPSAHASKRAKQVRASTPPASVTPTSPSASASDGSTVVAADPAPTAANSDDGGLPGWVPPAIVAILAVAAGGIAVARRWTR